VTDTATTLPRARIVLALCLSLVGTALAALLLALSPHQIYYAQEARMYALATALTLHRSRLAGNHDYSARREAG